MSVRFLAGPSRPARRTITSVAVAAAALSVALTGSAVAGSGRSVPAPPTSPTSASQIQNIDQVRTAIKGYYGDTPTTAVDPVPNSIDGGDKALHTFSPNSAYAAEVAGIEAGAAKDLAKFAKNGKATGARAVLFDVDDTTLNTFNYEIYSNFVYNPTTNAAFVNAASFPAVPGMVAFEHRAEGMGYTVFFLTGRPEAQRAGTVANLVDQGYDVIDSHLYLKDLTAPWLSSCAPSCTTTQYKSLTRAHIESLGYDIVGNFGDQPSDLAGGYANQTYKIPNPMYYLP